MANVRTYSPKQSEIERGWRVIDAEGETLGRLATRIATILRGKDKPTYTTHMSVGDNVIVINAEKVRVTGQKEQNKIYYRHSQYPGGLRKVTLSTMREKHPDRIIQSAVKGMIPHNRLGRQIMRHLHIYAGPEHPHEAQMRAGMGAAGRRKQAELETQAQQPAVTSGVVAPVVPQSRRRRRATAQAADEAPPETIATETQDTEEDAPTEATVTEPEAPEEDAPTEATATESEAPGEDATAEATAPETQATEEDATAEATDTEPEAAESNDSADETSEENSEAKEQE